MSKLEFFCITPELSKNGVSVKIHSSATATSVSYEIKDASGNCVSCGKASVQDGAFFAELKDAHLWTIEDPYLYTMSAEIEFSDGSTESYSDQFGMRSLCAHGQDILLNGKPFFIRAFIRGTVCHDHENILDLPEEEYYAKCIRIAKEYGFNTIRFHSRVPSQACFRAADKLGMFIHLIGGILGLVIMLALAYLGTTELLTPTHVLLYQLVWMVPGLLITEWTRSV